MDAAESPDSVVPAADRAAAARSAIDAWLSDGRDPQLLAAARIRFAHWLETDPKAAIAYWNGSGGRQSAEDLAEVARNHLLLMDPDELVDWFTENRELASGDATVTLLAVLANACVAGKNLVLLERARAKMDPISARAFLLITISAWPTNDLKLIEECVRENPDSNLVRKLISRMPPGDVVSWIRNEIATNGSLTKVLTAGGMATSALATAYGTSIKERIALLEEIEASEEKWGRSGITPSTLVEIDVRDWLARLDADGGPLTDWRHRLRRGEISASQVMAEARRTLPGAANEQPEEFRDRMFNELVAINPTSAMEIISILPLQQRERAMIKAGMNVAGQADPRHLMELVSTLPPTMATPVNDRFQVWCRAAGPSYAKYGDSYVSWVAAMPPGIEQDWALSGLSIHFRTSDPEKSAYLTSLKTLPVGWHPDK